MDLAPITGPGWDDIGSFINLLWLFLASVLLLGGSFLLAQAVLPSLVSTGHLPSKALKLRPILYVFSLLFLGLAGFFLARAISQVPTILEFYPRFWM
jgi:ABC-type Na+ efflux pump permease subunit